MAPPRIQAQDPSMSPTYSMSTNQTTHPVPPSLRRNLFAGHLSRRPQPTVDREPFTSVSPEHIQTRDVQYEPDPFSSGPSLQPSKRNTFQELYDSRPSSTHDVQDPSPTARTNTTFSRDMIVAVHPVTGRPVLPNIPNLPPRLRLTDDDDGDDDGEEEGENSDLDQDQAMHRSQHSQAHRPGFTRSPSYHNNLNHISADVDYDYDYGYDYDHDYDLELELDSSELERISSSVYAAHGQSTTDLRRNLNNILLDTNAEESRADRERIERVLSSMVSRQRARARMPTSDQHASSETAVTHTHQSRLPTTSTTTAATTSRGRRNGAGNNGPASNTNTVRPTSRPRPTNRQHSPQKHDLLQHQRSSGSRGEKDSGPVGTSMDPHEKDELMGLIMTSLRRKLHVAEEEGWMYGGSEGLGGVGSIGIGLEDDGVYD